MLHILTLGNAAWDDTNALGNTYSNLFSHWDFAEFSNVYTREAPPNNRICRDYFCITDKMLLQNILCPQNIGRRFSTTGEPTAFSPAADAERKLIFLIHQFHFKPAYVLEDWLWSLKGWQNRNYEAFLKERQPDVIFSFAVPTTQMLLQLQYIRQITGAPVVTFLVDHVCRDYIASGGRRGRRAAENLRQIFALSDKIYAITEELQAVYSRAFSVELSILRKGCDFSSPLKQQVGNPVRIVYAGNLLCQRASVLEVLGNTIARMNSENPQLKLDIYSGTAISRAQQKRLTIPNACEFHGRRPFSRIRQCLQEADIVLHLESFDPRQMECVKYSFSTKITDALECGSAFLVIGPKGLSSVEYPRHIPGAMVVDDLRDLEAMLRSILRNKGALVLRAKKIRDYALAVHSIETVHARLKTDFLALCRPAGSPSVPAKEGP